MSSSQKIIRYKPQIVFVQKHKSAIVVAQFSFLEMQQSSVIDDRDDFGTSQFYFHCSIITCVYVLERAKCGMRYSYAVNALAAHEFIIYYK